MLVRCLKNNFLREKGFCKFLFNYSKCEKHEFVAPAWDRSSSKYGISVEKWQHYNNVVWPPDFEDGKKPGEVYHARENVKYSWRKMWLVCQLIRGLDVDDALVQLSLTPRKGAMIMKEIVEEAKEKASSEHGLTKVANLWIAEAISRRGLIVKGLRRHARERWGTVYYRYCDVYVRLEEGRAPTKESKFCGWKALEKYLRDCRNRKIMYQP